MKRVIQLGLAAAALSGAGCGGDSAPVGSSAVASPDESSMGNSRLAGARPKTASPGTTISTARSQYGSVLFSKSGRAIYFFDKESGRTPNCYGDCAAAWPPVLTSGKPQASGSVKPGLLGVTQRSNGKKQATYKGHPLYFYVDDPNGEVECHNVEEFGGLWLAVKPGGSPVPVS